MSPSAQRVWRRFKRIAPWVLAALALTLVARLARTVDWPAVWQALQTQSPGRLAVAAALALISYALYASFDLIGCRLAGQRLTTARTLGTAAISYAFNLNFGSWIGGLALRLRLYTRWGLPVPAVVQVIAHSLVTNWLGYLWVGGMALLWAPPPLPEAWVLTKLALRAIALAMIATAVTYLALCRFSRRRRLTMHGYALRLPNGCVAVWQSVVGGANWLLIGTIVWALFGGRIDYPAILSTLLVAAVAGVITHVPANLGVLEAVFVGLLGNRLSANEVLATMLAYRATYFLLPLTLALPAYGLTEAVARRGYRDG